MDATPIAATIPTGPSTVKHSTEGKTLREHGCIIVSQHYDTAYRVASELAEVLPTEPVAVCPPNIKYVAVLNGAPAGIPDTLFVSALN